MRDLKALLSAVREGGLSVEDAAAEVRSAFFQNLEHTTLDHDRAQRTGASEVVFGAGKSAEQISDIVNALFDAGNNVLVTRLDADKHAALSLSRGALTHAEFHKSASLLRLIQKPVEALTTSIGVVTAGTSDLAAAEEAALTAEFFGSPVLRISDVGVAGLHRLLARIEDIRRCRVVVVAAGMEGALPSVVGGLVQAPVIALPTSVGYGASFGGVAALLGMLNSCASGVSVVNIDNGFGAGFLAHRINRL